MKKQAKKNNKKRKEHNCYLLGWSVTFMQDLRKVDLNVALI